MSIINSSESSWSGLALTSDSILYGVEEGDLSLSPAAIVRGITQPQSHPSDLSNRVSLAEPIDFVVKEDEREKFVTDPLFKFAAENEAVFTELVERSSHPDFQTKYLVFLKDIQTDTWFETYHDPIELGYLALMAYCKGGIDKNELCNAQLIAEAMQEKLKGNIVDFTITVENHETIAETLKNAHYPPFDNLLEFPLIRSDTEAEELEKVRNGFLDSMKTKSPLARTVLSYHFKNSKDSLSLEQALYDEVRMREGFVHVVSCAEYIEGHFVLPPLSAMVELSGQLRKNHQAKSFSDQILMFGHGDNFDTNQIFQSGVRLVSIGSPLFAIEHVHDCGSGPKGLGCTAHDFYHLCLDIENRALHQVLDLHKALSMEDNSKDKKLKQFLDLLLDRELRFNLSDFAEPPENLTQLLVHWIEVLPFYLKTSNKVEALENTIWVYETLIPKLDVILSQDAGWDRKECLDTLYENSVSGFVFSAGKDLVKELAQLKTRVNKVKKPPLRPVTGELIEAAPEEKLKYLNQNWQERKHHIQTAIWGLGERYTDLLFARHRNAINDNIKVLNQDITPSNQDAVESAIQSFEEFVQLRKTLKYLNQNWQERKQHIQIAIEALGKAYGEPVFATYKDRINKNMKIFEKNLSQYSLTCVENAIKDFEKFVATLVRTQAAI
jgi:hypothetical protein